MAITITNSTYPRINVLELTPGQLEANEALAETLAQEIVAFVEALPQAIKAVIPSQEPGLKSKLERTQLNHLKDYLDATHTGENHTPLPQEEARKILRNLVFTSDKAIDADLSDPHVQAFDTFITEKIDPFISQYLKTTKGSREIIVSEAFATGQKKSSEDKILAVKNAVNYRLNIASIEEEIKPDSRSFAQAIEHEITRRELFLNAITEIMAEHGIAFDAKKLLSDYSNVTQRIMSSDDMIIADYLPENGTSFSVSTNSTENIFAFVKEISPKQKYTFCYAFANLLVPEKDGEAAHRRTASAYLLDPRLLKEMKDNRGDDQLDQRLLQGYLTLSRVVDYDYFHGMTVLEGSNPVFAVPDSTAQKANLYQAFEDSLFSSYETLAQHLQYKVMQRLFEQQPQIKERIIEQAVSYMESVQVLRDRMIAAHPEKQAETTETAEFLTQIYSGRLFHIIHFNDPDLERNVRTERGNTSSIKEQLAGIFSERPAFDKSTLAYDAIQFAKNFKFQPERILGSAVEDMAHVDPALFDKFNKPIIDALGKAGLLAKKIDQPADKKQQMIFARVDGVIASSMKAGGNYKIKKAKNEPEYEVNLLEIKAAIRLLHLLSTEENALSFSREKCLKKVRSSLLDSESPDSLPEEERKATLRVVERMMTNQPAIDETLKTITAILAAVSHDTALFPRVRDLRITDILEGKAQNAGENDGARREIDFIQKTLQQIYTVGNSDGAHPTINPVSGFNALRERIDLTNFFMLEAMQNLDIMPGGKEHYTASLQAFNLALKSRAELFGDTPVSYQRKHTQGMLAALDSREAIEDTRRQLGYEYFLGKGGKEGLLTRLDTDLRSGAVIEAIGSTAASEALSTVTNLKERLVRIATGLETGSLAKGRRSKFTVSSQQAESVETMKRKLQREAEEIVEIVTKMQTHVTDYNPDEASKNAQALIAAASDIAAQKKKASPSI